MATADPIALSPARRVHPPLGWTNHTAARHAAGGGTKAGRWWVTRARTHTQNVSMDAVMPHE